MATCKDCVHVEACSRKQKIVIDGLNRAARYAEKFTNEKIEVGCSKEESLCELFCDRSRFVELPCNLGDEVFYFDTAGRIYTSKITQFIHGSTGLLLDSDVMFNSNLVGKRFFFSREAAEQALKERGENEK